MTEVRVEDIAARKGAVGHVCDVEPPPAQAQPRVRDAGTGEVDQEGEEGRTWRGRDTHMLNSMILRPGKAQRARNDRELVFGPELLNYPHVAASSRALGPHYLVKEGDPQSDSAHAALFRATSRRGARRPSALSVGGGPGATRGLASARLPCVTATAYLHPARHGQVSCPACTYPFPSDEPRSSVMTRLYPLVGGGRSRCGVANVALLEVAGDSRRSALGGSAGRNGCRP